MDEKSKKAVKLAAVGTAAAVGIAIGAAFSSPGEIISGSSRDVYSDASYSVVQSAEEQPADGASEDTRRGFLARVRSGILRMPTAVRILLVMPVWAVGKALILLLTGLVPIAGRPLLSAVCSVAFNALLLFALFAGIYKVMFPHRSIRSFFKKRNVTAVLVGALVLAAADAVLPLFWDDYNAWSVALRLAAGALVLAVLWYQLFMKKRKGFARRAEPSAA